MAINFLMLNSIKTILIKCEAKTISHNQNSSKIQSKNRRKKQNFYPTYMTANFPGLVQALQ